MCLEKLKLKSNETIMVGDWPDRDVVGAKKIGMKTAFARYGDTFGTVNSGADWDLNDIYQLVMIIDEFNCGV
jgi:putative hydrolase of the HAD superfamily